MSQQSWQSLGPQVSGGQTGENTIMTRDAPAKSEKKDAKKDEDKKDGDIKEEMVIIPLISYLSSV